jgi:hypothetical protein
MSTKESLLTLLLANPIILLILGVVGVVILIVPIIILWTLHLLTGVIMAILVLVLAGVAIRLKLVDLQKYPMVGPAIAGLTIFAFFFGYIGERSGAFYVMPALRSIAPPAMLVQPTVYVPNLETIFLVVIVAGILLAFVGAKKT